MAGPSTNGTVITRLNAALYGTYLSNATYLEVQGTSATVLAGQWWAADFAGKTDAQVANIIIKNLDLSSVAGAANYIIGQLGKHLTPAAKGAELVNMLNTFAQQTEDAAIGSAAEAFNTKISSALNQSQTAGNAGGAFGSADAVVGKAITLTTSANTTTGGVDEILGTSSPDRINGVFDVGGGTATSYDASDVIYAGDGVDTLALTLTDSSGEDDDATVSSPVATGLEILNISNSTKSGEATTVDASNLEGLTTVGLTASLDNRETLVSGLSKIVEASMSGAGSLELVYDSEAIALTTDVQKLTLNGTKEGDNETNIFTADGVETLAITAKADSVINVAGDAITKITVDGAAKYEITDAPANGTVKTIDASAATGAGTVNALGTAVTSVKTGAGSDVIFVNRTMTKDVAVDGGAGNDTLFVTNATFTATDLSKVTNVESVGLASDANTSLDVASVTGLTGVLSTLTNTTGEVGDAEAAIFALDADGDEDDETDPTAAQILTFQEASSANATAYGATMSARGTGTLDVSNLVSGSTVTLSSIGLSAAFDTNPALFDLLHQENVTLDVKGASKVDNTSDVINLVVIHNNESTIKNTALGASSAAKNLYVIDIVTIADVETVKIDSQGTFAGSQITSLAIDDASSLVLTGSNALTIGSSTSAGLDVTEDASASLDASTMTGRLTVTISNAELANFDGGFVGATGAADGLTIVAADGADIATVTKGFETITVRADANATGTVNFASFEGATKYTLRLAADTGGAGSDTFTAEGLKSGASLFLTNTQGADNLTINGAGASSSLKLVISEDLKTTTAYESNLLTLSRVGDLTIDTTRVDGTDSDSDVTQQATTFGGITSTTLKTLTVTGASDADTLDLGQFDGAATGSLLNMLDLSAYPGAIAGTLLDGQAGSKDVTIKLNKASTVGTSATPETGDNDDDDDTDPTADTAAGITLGAGSDIVVFDSNIAEDVVLGGFNGAVGATVSTKADKLNLSALGVSLSDLTFTDYDNGDDDAEDDSDADSVMIEIDGVDGRIFLIGTLTEDLNASNFIF
jgi:hypothetical protein